MLDTDKLNVWSYGKYATNVLSFHIYNKSLPESWRIYSVYFLHLFPQTFPTSGDEMRLSFLVNSKDYYHKHGIENFLHNHDYDHVLFHVHDSRMMLHSL